VTSKRLIVGALALPLAAAAAAGLLLTHAPPTLTPSEVRQALARRETVYARGWLYPTPGVEWHYALWAQKNPGGDWESKGMLVPGVGAGDAEPTPQVQELCDAIASCWLPRHWRGSLRGRRVERAGLPVWEFQLDPSRHMRDQAKGRTYTWRLLVRPDTKLVQRLEISITQDGAQRLAAWCDYDYDLPLPPGFEQAPAP